MSSTQLHCCARSPVAVPALWHSRQPRPSSRPRHPRRRRRVGCRDRSPTSAPTTPGRCSGCCGGTPRPSTAPDWPRWGRVGVIGVPASHLHTGADHGGVAVVEWGRRRRRGCAGVTSAASRMEGVRLEYDADLPRRIPQLAVADPADRGPAPVGSRQVQGSSSWWTCRHRSGRGNRSPGPAAP
jgi:hypothetical protein